MISVFSIFLGTSRDDRYDHHLMHLLSIKLGHIQLCPPRQSVACNESVLQKMQDSNRNGDFLCHGSCPGDTGPGRYLATT